MYFLLKDTCKNPAIYQHFTVYKKKSSCRY